MYNRGTGDYLIAFALPVNPKHDPPRRIPWPLPDASQAVTSHEILPDGRIHLAIEHRPLPGVTPEMLAWWYRVLPFSQVEFDGALRPLYHLFHPTEHGRIWIEAPAADGRPGVGAGGIVARFEWFGPYDSEGAARVVELSPRRFVSGRRSPASTSARSATSWGNVAAGRDVRRGHDHRRGLAGDRPVDQRPAAPAMFSEGMLREWQRHQVEEVGLLPHFLPALYAQRNDRNIYRLPKRPEHGRPTGNLPGRRHERPGRPRSACSRCRCSRSAAPAFATTLIVTDPAGQPLATVMVRERPADGPNLDTSDNGYPAPGVRANGRCPRSRASATPPAASSSPIATRRWNTWCASPATRTSRSSRRSRRAS